MGGCCPCWNSNDHSSEYTPINPREPSNSPDVLPDMNKSQYYQTVVDSAQRKFINSSSLRVVPMTADSEDLKSRVTEANIALDVLISPRNGRNWVQWESNSSSQQVVDILSEPVAVNNYDIVADEMAEMVAKHTFTLNVDDSMNNSTVASFKPVSSAMV
mmetsp:Transcript_22664/g.33129  ORF Transcript_22664/g.33129 Transcript_22664/m.33129 type:complete len:159 (-) Transcript_22664:155-631(-)|eukprot:CAMPEP_0185025134 /NCGR_PEP_ID=MMETSP1103-20130426/8211_1 /TAXON_ID=36769 /ORGANISM="Paraphysomonas bandaiensis, Strain Caron Lab Isolate" /LENGTH=158 /DNA_ID=CAMNT_0027558267 /DNA_START=132 /DNA_END=608 /DNA_ORIENTATION=-